MKEALDAPAHVASVTLIVRDLERVAGFYARILGLTPAGDGAEETTLSGEDGAPLLRLVRRSGAGATDVGAPDARAPGLFHTAFLLPSRRDLARWIAHAQEAGAGIEGASDHRVSEAIYLSDPEGNGIEVYVDRPRAAWPREGDGVAMATDPLDGASLMSEIRGGPAEPWRFPAGGGVGHVHLKVGDLDAAEAFYRERLGMQVMARYPGAVFLSWGGYHHHLAVNVWRSRGAGPRGADAAGLGSVAIAAGPGNGAPPTGDFVDPSGNRIIVQAA